MEEGIVCGRDRAAQARLTGPLPLPAREMAGLLQEVFRQPHFVVLRTPELDVGPRLDPGREQLRLHRECEPIEPVELVLRGGCVVVNVDDEPDRRLAAGIRPVFRFHPANALRQASSVGTKESTDLGLGFAESPIPNIAHCDPAVLAWTSRTATKPPNDNYRDTI